MFYFQTLILKYWILQYHNIRSCKSEFESHWVPHSFGHVLHLSKTLVTYWPLTEPSIKKQVHPVEDITLTCGRVEFGADATPTRSRWSSNNYITRCHRRLELVGVGWLEFELQFEAVRTSSRQRACGPQDPSWAAPQKEEEVLLWPEELGVNMLQSVPSPTHLSHTTLSQPFRE